MRKRIALLLTALMVIALTACAESTDKPDGADADAGAFPLGIYQFSYLSDADGNYLEEANETVTSTGEKKTLLQMMYDAEDVWYFSVGEDGKGFLTDTASDIQEKEVTFQEGKIVDSDGNEYAFKGDANSFRYEESSGSWAVMEKTTQGVIDLILAGKGGSVPLGEAKVGDLVCLGNYEQIPGNDRTEPIVWRVLDKKENNLLLLSEKLLDSFAFNRDDNGGNDLESTWRRSSIRNFLNGEFIETCFSTEEAALMVTTRLDNDEYNDYLSKYWKFKKDPYKKMKKQKWVKRARTEDKVFLLSLGEVLQYFGEDDGELPEYKDKEKKDADYPFSQMPVHPNRVAYVTKTVAQNGEGYFNSDTLEGAWMTRTLCNGMEENTPAVVYVTGGRGQLFSYYLNAPLFIRPAMWVSAISVSP